MTNRFPVFKVIVLLLVEQIFLEVSAFAEQGIALQGESTRTLVLSGQTETIRFQLALDNCRWRVRVFPDSVRDDLFSEISWDGTNVYAYALPEGSATPNSSNLDQPTAVGAIYNGPVPMGNGHLQGIWLAYCTRCLRLTNGSKFPNLLAAEQFLSQEYAEVQAKTNDQLQLTELDFYMKDGMKKWLQESLHLLEITNSHGRLLPMSFERVIYSDPRPDLPQPLEVTRYDVRLVSYEESVSSDLSPPKIDRPARIIDARRNGFKIPAHYNTTNWVALADVPLNAPSASHIRPVFKKRWMILVLLALSAIGALLIIFFESRRRVSNETKT